MRKERVAFIAANRKPEPGSAIQGALERAVSAARGRSDRAERAAKEKKGQTASSTRLAHGWRPVLGNERKTDTGPTAPTVAEYS